MTRDAQNHPTCCFFPSHIRLFSPAADLLFTIYTGPNANNNNKKKTHGLLLVYLPRGIANSTDKSCRQMDAEAKWLNNVAVAHTEGKCITN